MAPARKRATTRRKTTKRAPARKTARKAAKKATRKTARKAAKKTTRKTAKKAAKRATKKTARKTARKTTKKTARKAARKPAAAKAATASRPATVKFSTRKKGVFTTQDLIDHIHSWNPEMKRTQAKMVVEDVLGTLHTAVKKTDKVRLKGLGTITKKKIAARRGGKLVKNPFTGEMVKQKPKAASVKVKLTPAKELKQP